MLNESVSGVFTLIFVLWYISPWYSLLKHPHHSKALLFALWTWRYLLYLFWWQLQPPHLFQLTSNWEPLLLCLVTGQWTSLAWFMFTWDSYSEHLRNQGRTKHWDGLNEYEIMEKLQWTHMIFNHHNNKTNVNRQFYACNGLSATLISTYGYHSAKTIVWILQKGRCQGPRSQFWSTQLTAHLIASWSPHPSFWPPKC